MKQIKNLKINWKKIVSALLTSTIITTLSGCCLDNHEEIIEEKNNTISLLEQEKIKLEQEKIKLQEQINELTVTPEPTVVSEDNVSANDLSKDGTINLFYENGVLKVDSIEAPYRLDLYKGLVQEVIKNGKKYLLDATDFRVLLSDYDSIEAPYRLDFYSYLYGGPDKGDGDDGWVREIVKKNGKKDLVDASDFRVLLSDYDSIEALYRLDFYSYLYGGPDKGDGSGWVREIVKNGKKYLVDANDFDFSILLASDYVSFKQNEANTTIEFADGHTEVYANKDFKPSKSTVLKK